MRARIRQDAGCYVGEVYGTWEYQALGYKVAEWTGWEKVTNRCMTKLGARLELEEWKDIYFPTEFELWLANINLIRR